MGQVFHSFGEMADPQKCGKDDAEEQDNRMCSIDPGDGVAAFWAFGS